jgi:hypothetical protein
MVGCCLLRSQYVVVAWSRSRLLVGRRSSCPFLTLHLAPSSIRAASCAAASGRGPRGASPDDGRKQAGDWGDDSITLLASVRDIAEA